MIKLMLLTYELVMLEIKKKKNDDAGIELN